MEYINRQTINELIAQPAVGPALTIYAPMHKTATSPNMTEDQIRFKNLMTTAIEMLQTEQHDNTSFIKELQSKLESLLADRQFWESQTEGLLVCARAGAMQLLQLPINTEEYVAISMEYHLAPIFSLLQDTQPYFILSLSQHKPQLLQSNGFSVLTAEVALPPSIEAGLNLDEINLKSEQQRSTSASTSGGFNGRGGAKDGSDADRLKFWRLLDQIVMKHISQDTPLILAGVDAETAEFRTISKHSYILQATICGNQTGAALQHLHSQAASIIQDEILSITHRKAAAAFERTKGQTPERAVDDPTAIENLSEAGKIDTLLIAMNRITADTVQDSEEPVAMLSFEAYPETNEIVNEAALAVWRSSGSIINLERETMPERAPMLATLRY